MTTASLTFTLKPETNRLEAHFAPGETIIETPMAWVKEQLLANEYEHFYQNEKALNNLVKKIAKNEACALEIAEKRDSLIEITILATGLHAYLDITPAYGGKKATEASIKEAIQETGIQYGVIEEAIQKVVEAGYAQKILIARGLAPISGEDTRFEDLLPNARVGAPQIDEKGIADFKNLNEFVVVEKGTPLMMRTPPTLGTDGKDVRGNIIKAEPGIDEAFDKSLSGAILDPNNENILIADIKGHPVLRYNGVRVDNTLIVKKVDISTGNIDFDGSVHVDGDVEANLEIKATGDVVINGVLDRSSIHCQGNIHVSQGILGNYAASDKEKKEKTLPVTNTKISCGGCLSAKFIQNAIVDVEDSISVTDYIHHSLVTAKNQITAGAEGSKGNILGGHLKAKHFICADSMGSSAHIKTLLEVGSDRSISVEFNNISDKLRKDEAKLESLQKALLHIGKFEHKGKLTDKMKETLKLVYNTLGQVIPDIREGISSRCELQADLNSLQGASVIMKEKVFGGVKVLIHGYELDIKEDTKGGSCLLKKDKVIFHH